MTLAFTFEAFEQPEPGPQLAEHFHRHWPRYREWFLSEGEAARTSYAESLRALREHMPELVSVYEAVCELTGSGDLESRFLAMWEPPSYLTGCSQAVLRRGDPVLARNYDYAPARLEGAIMHTRWGAHSVIGTTDCVWGLLDGVNDAGLAVSLAFGGRKVVGPGFGVPLVVRYLLETCSSTEAARLTLRRLPFHLAHTLTIVDADGDVCTAYLSPDRGAVLSAAVVATNHQHRVEWAEHAAATRTVEREQCLADLLVDESTTVDQFVSSFLRPPLHSREYARGIGTLYTVAFHVRDGRAEYRWPGLTWMQSFGGFHAGTTPVAYSEASAA